MTCARLYTHQYVRKTTQGYQVRPCCISTGVQEYTNNITDLQNHKVLQDTRLAFDKGIFPEVCSRCKIKEDANKPSQRIQYNARYGTDFSLEMDGSYYGDIVDWDIRPSNTCNLKCVMCNPGWSSKWNEDVEIANKYGNFQPTIENKSFNWDYIIEKTVGKAQRISFLGGEPFYMKEVVKLLELLSQNEYNVNNTKLRFNTNGISFNDRLWNILSKFKNHTEITFSVEGIGKLNEYIRFPSVWSEWHSNFLRCVDDYKIIQGVNITIGAYNYPVMEEIVEYFKKYTDIIDVTYIEEPSFLTVDALTDKNKKTIMQNYFLDLDAKRGTNSKEIIPWIYND
jgi:sulfatase maturation enzyme AslB (radical SAM superfamily)